MALAYSYIDTHVHTHRSSAQGVQAMGGAPRVPGYTGVVEELLALMHRSGAAHAVMLNFTPVADMLAAARARLAPDLTPSQRREVEEEARGAMVGRVQRRNDWTCQVAREHLGLIAYIGIDPVLGPEGMAQEVERCHAQGARGVKLHTFVQRLPLNDRRLWPAYRAAQELGMAVYPHTGPFQGGDVPEVRPGLAAEVLREFPRLQLVLAHAGGRPYFQEAVALAREFPQAAFDCCGLVPGSPGPGDLSDDELVALFRDLGIDRVVYGSDWPWRDPVPEVARIARLPLRDDERSALLRDNAQRILRLG
ncbi:MAG: amidohydrolase [Chloroflexi bacterium]|nr:amidohydrolase [Chloroflexota bacterium]